ncbi:DUF1631 family protein [Spiribacter halobius]|uniref:Diguanylate cyclase n=1 Tax=Sediminicurvatus halobius TaxID=2182432 RepID=A0A2U2N8V0_9GAMM|nr:DUF1631 family protein [Spiribacter halobius]PWG65522.1 hypothetical protein DEM34_01935 [Spiribacter halobius]UEX76547.1 DUF1631 family protein [Spiribacter halobius]
MQGERRAFERHPVRWEAALAGPGGREQAVVIRDFCAGGFFLAAPDDGNVNWPEQGTQVEVRFHDPLSGADQRLSAQVARRRPAGVGLAFSRPRPDVVTVLQAVAEGQRDADHAGARTAPAAGVSRLTRDFLELARSELTRVCDATVEDFTAHVIDELFERSRRARDGGEQNAYFAGFRRLREIRGELPGRLRGAMLERLAPPSRPASAQERQATARHADELSLVDEREFEDWLSRAEVISRAESRFAAQLRTLNRRLTYIMGRRIDDERNPLGPTALCEALGEALPLGELDQRAADAVYEIFGRTVLGELGDCYATLNRTLRARGILPNLEEERPEIRSLGAGATRRERRPEPAAPTPRSDAGAESQSPEASAGPPTTATPAAPDHAAATVAANPRSAGGMPGAERVLGAYRRLQAAREETAASRTRAGAGDAAASASGQAQAADPIPAAAIMRAVEDLEQRLGGAPAAGERGTGLLAQVRESLGEGDRPLAPEAQEKVEVLDSWFGDVADNALNTDFLRDWSGRLAVLALKVELASGGFLKQERQPIHHLLDQLDRAGVALAAVHPAERESLRQNLDEVLQQALTESRERPEAIDEATRRIAEMTERPLGARAVNMQKVLQQCEGSQKLERAKRLVDRELDRRLARRQVAKLLADFIEGGWRNLLVLVVLRVGPKSDDWKRGLAVVDRLLVALGSGSTRARPIPEPEKVLAYIERQLTAFARYSPEMQKLVGEIRQQVRAVCRDGRLPRPLPMVRVETRSRDPEAEAGKVSPRWLGQAKLLAVGDWVFFAGRDGTPEPLRLQWVAEDQSRYVFVNRSGLKARDISLVELAQQLEAAAAGLAEDLDQPLTERQWQKKLQEMHDEMVRHATHDPLTGVLNRKAFLRELERLPARSGDRGRWHALIYLSLDGFKVINSTLGHEAGDRLLMEVAEQLRDAAGDEARIGRVGGDEFAVLLRDTTSAQAQVFAERQCRQLEERRFTQGTESLSVAASVGVLPFSQEGRVAGHLLRDADEACLAAKQAGGRQIHMITPDDRELAQLRGSMARAAKLDSALESGGLRLRCQRIDPLQNDAGLRAFYEVLIVLLDGDGEPLPPEEFITAAERFGRMTAVDRWVIRELLGWCASHPDVLRSIDGFTVNLSGPTLNDGSFARFIAEQLEQTGVPGDAVCFEVTETAAVQNLSRAADLIHEVKRLGCRFSLDDFGSGLSSYSYLKNLPVDYLKVDGQFIRTIDNDAADHAMVRSINELAHFLGKRTIAEYVENDDILAQVREIGLDFGQGYGISRPMPIDQLV